MNFQTFDEQGFLVLERILPAEICVDLLQYVIGSFGESKEDYIIEPSSRVHSPLALNAMTQGAIATILESGYPVLNRFLSGAQNLVELSSITVFPYAKEQRMHADEYNVGKNLVSVFVNLAPTTAASGALRIIPGSHKNPDADYSNVAPEVLELPEGSAVLMNSKTCHGGGANQTLDKIRPVFYFSFGEPELEGPTYSIRPDVATLGKTLQDFAPAHIAQPKVARITKDVKPTLSPGTSILTSLCAKDGNALFLVSNQLVQKRVEIAEDKPWIQQIIAMVAEFPGQHSIEDIHRQIGIDLDWLIQFFDYYIAEDWFTLEMQ